MKTSKHDPERHPWELIYARDGRVFTELLPAFEEALVRFSGAGCRTILDLGCGNGRHVVAFQQQGFSVTGFDISPTGLTLTREWLEDAALPIQLIQGDIYHHLPFEQGAFQGLFSTQVIHHALLAEVRGCIQEIWRVLAPGGLAFVTVAGGNRGNRKSREIEPGTFLPLEGDEKGLPHHIFSLDELREEFSSFEVLEIGPRAEGKVSAIWVRKPA